MRRLLVADNGAAVVLEGVTKTFGPKVAVQDFDLTVPTGCICGFLGPNGAGKTTSIRILMSILFADEGRVHVLGHDSAMEAKDRIGYLPEERGVYRTMKVGDFLSYMARLKGVDSRGLSKKIDEWLERVALPEVKKKKCQELSKGMQQKVQFVSTVIHDPELIILDEPFSGLDPVNARLLRGLIMEEHERGKTILFSTHVLYSAEQLCDRVVMINKGRKVLDGTLEQIRTRFDPRTVVVEPLNGTRLDASVFGRIAGVQRVDESAKTGTLELRLQEGADKGAALAGAARAGEGQVRRVELRSVTLEDVFIEMVEPGDSEDQVRASVSEAQEFGADA
ncbi:MAG: ABC transporter ATP-binding protein [Phycisphaerales bacterium]